MDTARQAFEATVLWRLGAHRESVRMPVSFNDARMIPAMAPDGRWFEVDVARADGAKPWPIHTGWPILVARLLYRSAMRARYVLTRRKWWAVRVLPMMGSDAEAAPRDRWPRDQPLFQAVFPSLDEALHEADVVRRAILKGDVTWERSHS